MNYYQFFKLCRIDLSKDDVNGLENDGFDMEMIFFIANNGTEDDIDAILTSLKSKVTKALFIRFRNIFPVIREHIRIFTANGVRLPVLLLWWILWNGIAWIGT